MNDSHVRDLLIRAVNHRHRDLSSPLIQETATAMLERVRDMEASLGADEEEEHTEKMLPLRKAQVG